MIDARAAHSTDQGLELDSGYANPQSDGCPVVATASGKIVAMFGATPAAPTLWPPVQAPGTTDSNARAARLNRTIAWQTGTLAGFLAERHKLDDFNRITQLLDALVAVKTSGESLAFDVSPGGGASGSQMTTTVAKVLEQNATLPLVAELLKIKADLADKKMRRSARDINRRFGSVLSQAKTASARQVQDWKPAAFSPYYRPAAELALTWRSEADRALAARIDAVGR